MKTITTIVLCLLLAGCVMAVDKSLPYDELPAITVATEVKLVASPAHPTAYLFSAAIAAGERVQVIGTDKNAAWLLVLHDNILGWMPTVFSKTNIATLKPAIVVEPLAANCTEYLDAIVEPNETWESNTAGAVIVVGSIYRPQTGKQFDAAALAIQIDGSGAVIDADYVHTPLTPASAVILFAYSVTNLQKGDQISFEVSNPGNEPLFFQAAFFANDCPQDLVRLPIGKTKIPVTEPILKEDILLASQPLSTITSKDIEIFASQGWQDTSINIRSGQRLTLTSTGTWSHGPDSIQPNPFGPEGTTKYDANTLLPAERVGSLIGRIGMADPFRIGENISLIASTDGQLKLSMNDDPGTYNDNSGSLNVTVVIEDLADDRQPETTKEPIIIKPSEQSSDAQQASDCIQPPDGLVSWWPGDGNADDIVGVNDGKLVGGTTFASGKVEQAFSLDGVDDTIDLGTNNIIGSKNVPFSVAMWMYSTKIPTGWYYFTIKLKQDSQFFVAFSKDFYASGDYVIATFRGATQWLTEVDHASILNQWTHVAIIYNGGNKSSASSFVVFLNGVQLSTASVNLGTAGGRCNNNTIGSDGDNLCGGNSAFFKGLIDEVQVYNRSLDSKEIQAIYNAGSTGICK